MAVSGGFVFEWSCNPKGKLQYPSPVRLIGVSVQSPFSHSNDSDSDLLWYYRHLGIAYYRPDTPPSALHVLTHSEPKNESESKRIKKSKDRILTGDSRYAHSITL